MRRPAADHGFTSYRRTQESDTITTTAACTALAAITVTLALAAAPSAHAAISGATVFSDSTVTTTAKGSSAVVSLGKLGRVE